MKDFLFYLAVIIFAVAWSTNAAMQYFDEQVEERDRQEQGTTQ